MKKFRTLSFLILICLLLSIVSPAALALEPPEVTAQSWIIIDMNTGEVIAEHNADEPRSPASLTKIMTGLLAVEAVEAEADPLTMEEIVTAGYDCQTGMDSSSSNASIVAGEKMSFQDFFYCAMVVSANDACNVIASHISGSIGGFVEKMNARAAELGLKDTRFVDPNGLSYDNITTARELSVLLQEALKHEAFAEAFSTSYYTVPKTNYNDERNLKSTDALTTPDSYYSQYGDYSYQYAVGAKTGFTRRAGYCLASVAEKDDMKVMIVVLGCPGPLTADSAEPESFNDTIALYNWAFENFSYQTVLTAGETIGDPLPVNQAEGDAMAKLQCTDSLTLLLPKDLEGSRHLTISIYEDRLNAPIAANTVLGSLMVKIGEKEYGPFDLITKSEIKIAKTEIMQDKVNEFVFSREVLITGIVLLIIILLYITLVIRYRALHRKHLREKRRAEKRREAARRQRQLQNESGADGLGEPTQRFTAIHTVERDADAIDLGRFFDEVLAPEQKPEETAPESEPEDPAPAEPAEKPGQPEEQ